MLPSPAPPLAPLPSPPLAPLPPMPGVPGPLTPPWMVQVPPAMQGSLPPLPCLGLPTIMGRGRTGIEVGGAGFAATGFVGTGSVDTEFVVGGARYTGGAWYTGSEQRGAQPARAVVAMPTVRAAASSRLQKLIVEVLVMNVSCSRHLPAAGSDAPAPGRPAAG